MKINLKAQHTSITPAMADYLEKRLGGLAKFSRRASEKGGEMTIDVDAEVTTHHHLAGQNLFMVKGTLNLGDLHLYAEASDADMYAAIDGLKDELMRQLVSDRKRRGSMIRWGGQKIKKMLRGLGIGEQE